MPALVFSCKMGAVNVIGLPDPHTGQVTGPRERGQCIGATRSCWVGKLRDDSGHSILSESERLIEELRSTSEKMGRILDGRPWISHKEIGELSRLSEIQARLLEQNPRFCSAEERFRIDAEKLHAMNLLQLAEKFLESSIE